jgi:hypothetical protein
MKAKRTSEERKIARGKASRRWAEAHPEKVKESKRRWAEAHPEKVQESNRRWAAAHPEKAKEGRRRRAEAYRAAHPEECINQKVREHYGEEAPEHYRKQYEKQKGKCGICEKPVHDRDHRHIPFKLRGWLCRHCNIGLHFMEDIVWKESAYKYLKEWA